MLRSWLRPKGSSTRLNVDVTFLEARSACRAPSLPEGFSLLRADAPAVPLYRRLYEDVGGPWCWWMRRPMSDARLAAILHDPDVHFMVLRDGSGAPLGFYELDLRVRGDGNLAYFGLVPGAIGRGLGGMLLDCAIAQAFEAGCWRLRVNTCTLDHPRALPNYRRAGFAVRRTVSETWDVPDEYLPERLRPDRLRRG